MLADPAGPRRTPARTAPGRIGDPRASRDPTAALGGSDERDEVGARRDKPAARAWRRARESTPPRAG
jgi:hypothetical protein